MTIGTTGGRPKGTAGLALAISLGVALLLFSFLRVLGDLGSSAGHVSVVQSAIPEPFWRTRLAANVVLFAVALLALHLAFAGICWVFAVLSGRAFPTARVSRRQWVFVWFLGTSIWLLVANATFFPHSSLGEPYQSLMATSALGVTPYAAVSTALAAALLYTFARALWRTRADVRLAAISATGAALLAAVIPDHLSPGHAPPAAGMPNVIVVGIDSLRTDVVQQHAPEIHGFLQGAVRFEDAITPLARTFPSWVSILSGKHPHTTGAFLNLLPRDLVETGSTLPQLLRDRGYRTFYAIDETRFSNVDASFGFDRTVMPRMGGSDFVLALAADAPLLNLVLNTRLGAVLFPHLHANRAAHFTYDPDAFVHRIEREIDFSGPMMLATHLTLPHYPFTWATSAAPTGNDLLGRGDYFEAIRRADRQFGDILALLDKRGVLDNALVIVLSDHGEAIGREDDLLPGDFPHRDDPRNDFQRWGHGSSVFSPSQYRVVLGMRAYGKAVTPELAPRTMDEPVSLVDIAPTVMDLLGATDPGDFDGVSLVPILRGEEGTSHATRIRYTETEYNPPGFTSARATASAIADALDVYRLDPSTDRVEIRREKVAGLVARRQYAALLGNRALAAAIPDETGNGTYEFVCLPMKGGATPEEVVRLREALQSRYKIAFSGTAGDT